MPSLENWGSGLKTFMGTCTCMYTHTCALQVSWSALHEASWNGHLEVVQILLDHRADIEQRSLVSRVYTMSYSYMDT